MDLKKNLLVICWKLHQVVVGLTAQSNPGQILHGIYQVFWTQIYKSPGTKTMETKFLPAKYFSAQIAIDFLTNESQVLPAHQVLRTIYWQNTCQQSHTVNKSQITKR